MNFLNPWGLLFGSSIAIIILLYMLKPRHTELVISSTYLWNQTLKETEANRPWQRLKNNILMLLQILIVIFLVLALARPYLATTSIENDMIVVLDCSGSMQADDVTPTRFDRAKDEILKLIDGMQSGQRMAIISMGANSQLISEPTEDRSILRRIIEDMEPENGTSATEEALSIASSLSTQLKDAKVIIYSDIDYDIDDPNYHCAVINGDGENVSIGAISYSRQDDEIVALSKLISFGYEGEFILECYVDGELVDVKEVYIEDGQSLDIYWRGISEDARTIKVAMDIDDNLDIDNQAFAVIEEKASYRALLLSDRNIFLESALEQYMGLELTRAKPGQVEELKGYDIYILDGVEPKIMPEDGHIIFLAPKYDMEILGMDGGREFKPESITTVNSTLADELLMFTKLEEAYIARGLAIEPPSWGEAIVRSGDNPLLVVGELDKKKTALFLFDLHRSDLPLRTDFPILIQNLLNWMLPDGGTMLGELYAGDEAVITSMPSATDVDILGPTGEYYIGGPLQELGVYKVVQTTDSEEHTDYFVVNYPVHLQSDLKLQTQQQSIDKRKSSDTFMIRELWKYLLWVALALLLIEWWVYLYGY